MELVKKVPHQWVTGAITQLQRTVTCVSERCRVYTEHDQSVLSLLVHLLFLVSVAVQQHLHVSLCSSTESHSSA